MTHPPAMQGAGLICVPTLLGSRFLAYPSNVSAPKVRAGMPNQGAHLKPYSTRGLLFQCLEHQVFSPAPANPYMACSWTKHLDPFTSSPRQSPAYNTYTSISCLESSTKSANPKSNLLNMFLNLQVTTALGDAGNRNHIPPNDLVTDSHVIINLWSLH